MKLKNIENIEKFELNENMSVYSDSDTSSASKVFKIKIGPLSDLSGGKGNKRGNSDQAEEVPDYQIGDIVQGVAEDDQKEYKGAIVNIKYDQQNTEEIISVTIESDGRIIKLIPSTIAILVDKGVLNDPTSAEEIPNLNLNISQYTYENIKNWYDFK